MASETVDRMQALRVEIAAALRNGQYPDDLLREFRFLWATTPNQEKDGLGYTLRDIEQMVKDFRREAAINAGAGKMRYAPIEHRAPGIGREELYR